MIIFGSDYLRGIIKIKGESCSIGNFSVRLVKLFFSASELVNRNCMGTKGKEALDPDKLGEVKKCEVLDTVQWQYNT